MDEKTLTIKDIDLMFIATNSSKSGHLKRFEFFEIFVRLARHKYMDHGKATTID